MNEKTTVSKNTSIKDLYGIQTPLTKEKILNVISQEEIFEFYGIPVIHNEMFCSPLRTDEHPTCTFKYIGDVLYFRDWSEDKPLDCFGLVMHIKRCNFGESLKHVYKDLIKDKADYKEKFIQAKSKTKSAKPKHQKSIIKVKCCKWKKEAIEYLKRYHLTKEQIKKFKFYPIDKVWLNEKIFWVYSKNDPAFAYYFGKDEQGNQKWKIYFFNRDKKRSKRFITNTNRINGWVQLPEKGEVLIITKSMKDVACLDLFGLPAIAMQNETTIPYDYIINELKERFTKIISFYDFDRTGIVNANKMKKLYDIPYCFLTNGRFGTKDYGSKDFSDYLKLKGKEDAKRFLEETNIME